MPPKKWINYNKKFKDVHENDFPKELGTIFITKSMSRLDPDWQVNIWQHNPFRRVGNLGMFHKLADAELFAEAKSNQSIEELGEGGV